MPEKCADGKGLGEAPVDRVALLEFLHARPHVDLVQMRMQTLNDREFR